MPATQQEPIQRWQIIELFHDLRSFLIIFPLKVVSLEFLESGQCSIFSRSGGGERNGRDVIQPINVEGDIRIPCVCPSLYIPRRIVYTSSTVYVTYIYVDTPSALSLAADVERLEIHL